MRSNSSGNSSIDMISSRGTTQSATDSWLMQIKTPAESVEPWDYYKVVETFKGETAWTTKAESKCALWK